MRYMGLALSSLLSLEHARPGRSTPRGYRRIYRLNRSRNWRDAKTYAEARAKSPFPDRPVR